MAAIDWLTSHSWLATASGYGTGVAALAAQIDGPLYALGTVYTHVWSGAIDTAKAATPTVASRVSTWSTTTKQLHDACDAAGRFAESLQVTANTGKDPLPNRYTLDGGPVPLVPTAKVTFIGDDTAAVRAGATFSSVLRLEAKHTGNAGNAISATIANSTRTSPDPTTGVVYLKLTVSLGGLTETFDDLAVGSSPTGSALLQSTTWYAQTRPSNGTATFSGGVGGALADLTTRMQRAERLPAAASYTATLATMRAALAAAWAAKPTTRGEVPENAYTIGGVSVLADGTVVANGNPTSPRPNTGVTGAARPLSIMQLEDELTVLIARAEALKALVTYP